MNTEILMRLAQTVDEEEAAKVREGRLRLAMIEYLADSVIELAAMLPEEQRSTERVQALMDVAGRLVPPKQK